MDAELKQTWDPYVIKCEGDGSVTLGSAGIGAGVLWRILSKYTPNPNDVELGILLAIQCTKAGTGPINSTNTRYVFEIPLLSIAPTPVDVAAFRSNPSTHIEIDNLRLYHLGNRWRLIGDEIRWYIEGVLQDTFAGFDESSAANMRTPSAIPLIGIPPQYAPAALYNVAVPY